MDHIERYLQNLPRADSMDTVKQIAQRHDQMRLGSSINPYDGGSLGWAYYVFF